MAIIGTSVDAVVSKIVDGDTIHVDLDGEVEKLRILGLDTEESGPVSGKPETPFGHEAKAEVGRFFTIGDPVTLEFPGGESVAEALQRYRGNFGRLLVFVHRNGTDFTEHMISQGFSPYFTKYGNARFRMKHT